MYNKNWNCTCNDCRSDSYVLASGTFANPRVGIRVSGGEMKLSLIFALIDITILVAYPFVFLAGKMRQFLKIKR